jgi:hypothetical protein
MMVELEAARARFVALERELTELGARHDLAMSAFKFDAAREVQERITALELERAELEEALPIAVPPAPMGPVPVMVRRRRPPRRHRPHRR